MTEIILLDGGLGQELYRRSRRPAHPLWSLQVMRESPDLVQGVHEDFIRAGARVLTLNTYTATLPRLGRDGDPAWFRPLQEQAFSLAAAAREACGSPNGPVALGGCLPPLVGSYAPAVTPSDPVCRENYEAIVAVQPGVDLWIAETLSSIREGRAAAETALTTGKPVYLSFTVEDDPGPPRLRSGEPVEAMVEAVRDLPLSGLLLNCSTPEAIARALPLLADAGMPSGAYANGFVSVKSLKPGGTVDALSHRRDLDPPAYAGWVLDWIENGASIVGGCCEVGPDHLSHLRQRLEEEGLSITGPAGVGL